MGWFGRKRAGRPEKAGKPATAGLRVALAEGQDPEQVLIRLRSGAAAAVLTEYGWEPAGKAAATTVKVGVRHYAYEVPSVPGAGMVFTALAAGAAGPRRPATVELVLHLPAVPANEAAQAPEQASAPEEPDAGSAAGEAAGTGAGITEVDVEAGQAPAQAAETPREDGLPTDAELEAMLGDLRLPEPEELAGADGLAQPPAAPDAQQLRADAVRAVLAVADQLRAEPKLGTVVLTGLAAD